jgi:hypothetical protein
VLEPTTKFVVCEPEADADVPSAFERRRLGPSQPNGGVFAWGDKGSSAAWKILRPAGGRSLDGHFAAPVVGPPGVPDVVAVRAGLFGVLELPTVWPVELLAVSLLVHGCHSASSATTMIAAIMAAIAPVPVPLRFPAPVSDLFSSSSLM